MGIRGSSVRDLLREAREAIFALGSDEAAIEAELLVMHALGIDRVHLYQRLSESLSLAQSAAIRRVLERRLAREPVAYITRHKEFFGLDFEVSPAALIPRPETETLVEVTIAFARDRELRLLAEIGTGTGAVGVCLAKSLDGARVFATDTSKAALELAARNAARHQVGDRLDFRRGDLLEPISERMNVIAANLPYVTTAQWEALPPEIREHEPREALDGGPDGLTYIRRLFEQAPGRLAEGGALFCEIGDWQGEAVLDLARTAFPGALLEVALDLAGRDRVVCVCL